MSKVIETKELTVGYDRQPLISDVMVAVRPGDIVTLIGPNGAGKSTILKTIAGMLPPVAGHVFLDGMNFEMTKPNERAKRISVMLTGRTNHEYTTCYDVVAVGRYPYTDLGGHLTDADRAMIDDAFALVHADELKEADYAKISDGQRQRVLLARALVQNPDVLILDEPTTFLDIGYKLEFAMLLKKLAKEKQIGILVSLHELELAKAVSDTVVCIAKDKTIDRIGNPEEIFEPTYLEQLFSIEPGLLHQIYHI